MAIGNQAEQRAYIRRAVGHANDTALVSDELLDDCLNHALREVNQNFALFGFGQFTTVANQQEYSPLPALGYAITRAFWPATCSYELPRSVDNAVNQLILSEVIDEYGSRRTIEPSLVTAFYQNQEFFYRLFGEGAYIKNETEIFLDPIPTSEISVYFTFTKQRYATITDIADIHVEPYYASALCSLHEALAVGRGALTSVSSAGGVRMSTAAASHHLQMADRMRDRFKGFLTPLKPGRHWP